MRAIVTSTGEPTTELCVWSLERNGFDVELINNSTSLAEKLKAIYDTNDQDFLRVDADVIVNRNCTPKSVRALHQDKDVWWLQFTTYDWFKQDITHGGVQFVTSKALPVLAKNIDIFLKAERPESQMYRLEELHNPRRCESIDVCMGLHGFGVEDIQSVIKTKQRRNQSQEYDFELAERLSNLL